MCLPNYIVINNYFINGRCISLETKLGKIFKNER